MKRKVLCSWFANENDWENNVAVDEILVFEDECYTYSDYLYDNIETSFYTIEELNGCTDVFIVKSTLLNEVDELSFYCFSEFDEE